MDEIEQDLRGLRPAFAISQVVGLGMVVMMSIWTGHFLGGFSGQSVPELEFNWHPLLLTISLIYLYGNGILIYRVARNERKNKLKVAHAIGIYLSVVQFFKREEFKKKMKRVTSYKKVG